MCDAAVTTMFQIIKPLGLLLTTLPVGPGAPGMTAGPSFEMYRTGYILPHRHAAWVVIHERLLDLAANCVSLNTMQLSTPTKEVIVHV
jgi:hypothetical protein